MPDTYLIKLGRNLDCRIDAFNRKRTESKWTDERLARELRRFTSLEAQILGTPALSLAGLVVKAKLLLWLRGCDASDLSRNETATIDDFSVGDCIVLDILNLAGENSQLPSNASANELAFL